MPQQFLTLSPEVSTPYTTKVFKDFQKRILSEKQNLMKEYGVNSDTYDRLHRLATQILFIENHWENEKNRKDTSREHDVQKHLDQISPSLTDAAKTLYENRHNIIFSPDPVYGTPTIGFSKITPEEPSRGFTKIKYDINNKDSRFSKHGLTKQSLWNAGDSGYATMIQLLSLYKDGLKYGDFDLGKFKYGEPSAQSFPEGTKSRNPKKTKYLTGDGKEADMEYILGSQYNGRYVDPLRGQYSKVNGYLDISSQYISPLTETMSKTIHLPEVIITPKPNTVKKKEKLIPKGRRGIKIDRYIKYKNKIYDLDNDDQTLEIQHLIGTREDKIFGPKSLKALQRKLNLIPDSIYGPKTKAAVTPDQSVQKKNNYSDNNKISQKLNVQWDYNTILNSINPKTYTPNPAEGHRTPEELAKQIYENCSSFVGQNLRNNSYNVYGDAWTANNEIIKMGGKKLFSIYDDKKYFGNNPTGKSAIRATKEASRAHKNYSDKYKDLQLGDVIGLAYYNSPWYNKPRKRDDGTIGLSYENTHIGFISGFDAYGNPIVTHNIHGTVYNEPIIKGTTHGGNVVAAYRPTKKTKLTPKRKIITKHPTALKNKNESRIYQISKKLSELQK